MLSGCSGVYLPFPNDPEENHVKSIRMGLANHSKSRVYIYKAKVDNEWSFGVGRHLACAPKYDINGYHQVFPIYKWNNIPRRSISVNWYSFKDKTAYSAELELPEDNLTKKLVANPPWYNKQNNKGPKSVLYIDIKENQEVWLRLGVGYYYRDINDKSDVMLISKAKAHQVATTGEEYKRLDLQDRLECESESSKIQKISKHLSMPKELILLDNWYPNKK